MGATRQHRGSARMAGQPLPATWSTCGAHGWGPPVQPSDKSMSRWAGTQHEARCLHTASCVQHTTHLRWLTQTGKGAPLVEN